MISSNVYVVLNRNFYSNVNVLGRFYKHFLASLFDIFLKPDSKQKYLQVQQRQLSEGFIFAICQFKDLFCNICVNA